jgi:hypothetical protein
MIDWFDPDDEFVWRPIWIGLDNEGHRMVRFIEDVPLPQTWEVDKNILPVVE